MDPFRAKSIASSTWQVMLLIHMYEHLQEAVVRAPPML
jgi:hypothetical protein